MSACRSENASIRSGSSASDLVEPRVDERRDLGFLPGLGRPRRVARHADDAVAGAQEVQRLGRLLGQADDASGIAGHASHRTVIIIQCCAYRSDSRRRHRQGSHGRGRQSPQAVAEVSGRSIDLDDAALGRRPLSCHGRHDSAERLCDAAGRFRRDSAGGARRSARARQAACPRHPARHAIRARSLRQLPARQAARRPALPAEGPRRQGRQLRRVPREHRGRRTSASAAGSRPAPTTRSRFRKRSTPSRA